MWNYAQNFSFADEHAGDTLVSTQAEPDQEKGKRRAGSKTNGRVNLNGASILHFDHRAVILEFGTGTEDFKLIENATQRRPIVDQRWQIALAKTLALRIFRLRNAVGRNKEPLTGLHLQRLRWIEP